MKEGREGNLASFPGIFTLLYFYSNSLIHDHNHITHHLQSMDTTVLVLGTWPRSQATFGLGILSDSCFYLSVLTVVSC